MKRLLLPAILAVAVAVPAVAFDPTPHTSRSAHRLTVLRAPVYDGEFYEDRVASRVRQQLVRELQKRGFDAVEGSTSYGDLRRGAPSDSDLYIDIGRSDSYSSQAAGGEVRAGHARVDIAVLLSNVVSEVRVYDGRTLDLITKRSLHHEDVSVVPTAIGAGTYQASVWIAMPFIEYARYRAAVNAVVREAANEIAGVTR